MLLSEADYLINRILSGVTKCKIKDVCSSTWNLLIKAPSRYHRYLASEVYKEVKEEGLDAGLFTDQELDLFLLDNDLWNPDLETKMLSLQKDIEELKLKMFEGSFNTSTVEVARKVLGLAKADVQFLFEQKYSYNHLAASGFAEIEKNKFLIGMSLYCLNGELFLNEETYWASPAFILEQALTVHKRHKLTETDFRWLARNEPWRSYWISRKTEGSLFGVCSSDLTEDQRSLIIWSTIYDNVYENPEQPPQYVIEDDDILDGWFISQRRKREVENNKSAADQLIKNEKIKNSGEIFIPANSKEDLTRIASLNDTAADITKKQRLNYLNKHGSVSEAQMPDTKNEIRKQRAEMFKNHALAGTMGG